MLEREMIIGYMPEESFGRLEKLLPKEISPYWKKVKEILGMRTKYMVYMPFGCYYVMAPYISNILLFSQTSLSMEISKTLRTLIPCCNEHTGRRILLTDVRGINGIPLGLIENRREERYYTDSKYAILHEDGEYLVAILEEEMDIHMYIWLK